MMYGAGRLTDFGEPVDNNHRVLNNRKYNKYVPNQSYLINIIDVLRRGDGLSVIFIVFRIDVPRVKLH
jgi:hypothetical protein